MLVPVDMLKPEQHKWYARLVMAAVLADGELTIGEFDFIKTCIKHLKDPDEKKHLLKSLEERRAPHVTPPPEGIPDTILAAIFVELILIIISDVEFAEDEKFFLEDVNELLGFTKPYFKELMNWLEEGLAWKLRRQNLLPKVGEGGKDQVPVQKLDDEERFWYANILIHTILLDRNIERNEMVMLKTALGIVRNKKQQLTLMAYIKNRFCPKLLAPPAGMELDYLVLIFFDLMQLVAGDDALTATEKSYLEQVAQLCAIPKATFEDLLDWCRKGVEWRSKIASLIGRVQREPEAKTKNWIKLAFENHSLYETWVECFVCNGTENIRHLRLNPRSQVNQLNIFGRRAYLKAMRNHEYVDYHRTRLVVCPQCFFTASSKDWFKKHPKDLRPKALTPEFSKAWLEKKPELQQRFSGLVEQIGQVAPGDAFFKAASKTGREVLTALAQGNNDCDEAWELTCMTLDEAECLMQAGAKQEALELVDNLQQKLNQDFSTLQNQSILIRSARLLFFIALFKGEEKGIGKYSQFLVKMNENKENLTPKEMHFLDQTNQEIKEALAQAPKYLAQNCQGFHLR